MGRRRRPGREDAAPEWRRLVQTPRHAPDVRGRVFEARGQVPLLFHPPERDVDRAALELPLRRGDELQAVELVALDEQLEDERFLRGQREDAGAAGRHGAQSYS